MDIIFQQPGEADGLLYRVGAQLPPTPTADEMLRAPVTVSSAGRATPDPADVLTEVITEHTQDAGVIWQAGHRVWFWTPAERAVCRVEADASWDLSDEIKTYAHKIDGGDADDLPGARAAVALAVYWISAAY